MTMRSVTMCVNQIREAIKELTRSSSMRTVAAQGAVSEIANARSKLVTRLDRVPSVRALPPVVRANDTHGILPGRSSQNA